MKADAQSQLNEHRLNNFDFLRLLAAIAVLFSHCFALAGIKGLRDPLELASDAQLSLGNLGVTVFFLISGYLITQSFESSSTIFRYLKARCLRVFPGLFVLLLLSSFVLGPLTTELSLASYFQNSEVYTYLRTGFLITIQWELPGVFPLNSYKGVVNGSLWSIPYEFMCYLVVLFLGLFRLHAKKFIALSLVLFAALIELNFKGIFGDSDPHLGQMTLVQLVHCGLPFFCGMLFYSFRASIQFKPVYGALAVFALFFTLHFGGFYYFVCLAGGYLIFYFAFHGPKLTRGVAKYGDFSYGIYLYAFPVQQLVIHANGGVLEPYLQFLISLPLAGCLAWLSWHFVEKRALRLKNVRVLSRLRLHDALIRLGSSTADRLSVCYAPLARWSVPIVIVLGAWASVWYSSYTHPPSNVTFPFPGNQAFFKGGWLPQDLAEHYRWVNGSASVRMSSDKPAFKVVVKGFVPPDFDEVKNMRLELDGVSMANCDLSKSRSIDLEVPYDIGPFANQFTVTLVFDGVRVPGSAAVDQRKLSALISSISIK